MVLLILRKWSRGVQRSEGQRWMRTATGEVLGDLIPSLVVTPRQQYWSGTVTGS